MHTRLVHRTLWGVFLFAFLSLSIVPQASAKAGKRVKPILPATSDEVVLSEHLLHELRGTGDTNTILSAQSLEAATTGNTLTVGGDLMNGAISFGNHAGSMGSYVMNTGNNSTINSAVSLNVQIMAGP